jgi:small subunit ribosomal protein S3
LRRGDVSAQIIAQQIAFDIEKRLPYRRVMKKYLDTLSQNREIKGVKIKMSGRLNGAEISRKDWLSYGRMPLQTLRANIDYGEATAFNSYGTVGVKVWLYKGEIFSEKQHEQR